MGHIAGGGCRTITEVPTKAYDGAFRVAGAGSRKGDDQRWLSVSWGHRRIRDWGQIYGTGRRVRAEGKTIAGRYINCQGACRRRGIERWPWPIAKPTGL